MADQIEFIDGFFAKAPRVNAPDFVKANISIKREEMIRWLSSRDDEWVNIDVKEARSGKWYASVDNWKPNPAMANNAQNAGPNPAADTAFSDGSPMPTPPPVSSFDDMDDDIPF
jgi:hypothetical protein